MADIDDLLGGLGQGPRVPLASAESVLARGDALRRRQTQVVAGAAALLAVAAGGVFFLATSGGDGSVSLQPAETPSATPAVTAGPTATPTAPATSSPPVTPATVASVTRSPSAPPASTGAPTQQGPRRVTASDRLTLEGVGPVRLGMTVAQMEAVTGQKATLDDFLGSGQCAAVTLAGDDDTAPGYIVSDGKLILVFARGSARKSGSGVAIGDTEARVRQVYGSSLQERKVDFGGLPLRWLVVHPAGGAYELSMKITDGKVTELSVGAEGEGQAPEGYCV